MLKIFYLTFTAKYAIIYIVKDDSPKKGIDSMITALVSLALSTTFYSWFAPEVSEAIVKDVIRGESHAYLDYDGDGEETMLDAVGVLKRYYSNIENGNTYTFNNKKVAEIMEENGNAPSYWEIDFVDNTPCRKYEVTVDKVTRINLYVEYYEESYAENWTIEINPFKELTTVIDCKEVGEYNE